jgi:hypothetical protein
VVGRPFPSGSLRYYEIDLEPIKPQKEHPRFVGKLFPALTVARAFLLSAICFPGVATANDREPARITAVQREVRLVAADQTTRPVSINDAIVDGNSVATGADSRTEIKLSNRAVVRLSANAVVNFERKRLKIERGAMLVAAPRGEKARAEANGVAVELSGATAVLENQGDLFKFLLIEGRSRLHRNGHLGDSVIVGAGQMVFGSVKSALTDPVDFEIARFVKTCPLMQGFAPLPNDKTIAQASEDQLRLRSKKRLVDTNLVIFGGGSTVSIVDPLNNTGATTGTATVKPTEQTQQ